MKKNKKVILGVNSFFRGPHHDNGAFLFFGDDYIGINSERLDRVKYSSGYKIKVSEKGNKFIYDFDKAKACIDYCLNYFGLTYSDVDIVVYLEGLKKYVENLFSSTTKIIGIYDHHFIHAVSTYYSSGYEKAAILVMDGQGKKVINGVDNMVLQSFYLGEKNKIKLLKETKWNGNRKIGIGTLYEMVTKLLKLGGEGSTMGLSSYGKKSNILGKNLLKKYNGHYYINDSFIKGISGSQLKFLNRKIFLKQLGLNENDLELSKIPNGFSSDLALQLQIETENAIIDLANELYKMTKLEYLCIAGGVGLNSVANSKIVKKTKLKKVFILPSCDDSGLALGCALYGKSLIEEKISIPFSNYYFGKFYSEREIKEVIKEYKQYFSFISYEPLVEKKVASLLSKGKIIGWFQGRSETGPRALGNRSILARPDSLEIKNRVNKIKKRELWRPLTPSVLGDEVEIFFHLDEEKIEYKYMLKIVKVREEKEKFIEGIVHVDHTARIQVVFKKDNEKYYNLIEEYRKKTGIPMILNTSFNSSGEPIVETPEDAIKMFLSTELDYLVLGNYILAKNKIYEKFKFKRPIELSNILYKHWKKELIEYEKQFIITYK